MPKKRNHRKKIMHGGNPWLLASAALSALPSVIDWIRGKKRIKKRKKHACKCLLTVSIKV